VEIGLALEKFGLWKNEFALNPTLANLYMDTRRYKPMLRLESLAKSTETNKKHRFSFFQAT
jgi:hypothetical protein